MSERNNDESQETRVLLERLSVQLEQVFGELKRVNIQLQTTVNDLNSVKNELTGQAVKIKTLEDRPHGLGLIVSVAIISGAVIGMISFLLRI